MNSMFFTLIFLFFSLTAHAIGKAEGYEYLLPHEKQMLENGIAESIWPSYCSQTKDFALQAKFDTPITQTADFILVDKKRRQIHLLKQNTILASYRMALGENPVGDKVYEGDSRTPEGVYFVDLKNRKSEFHLSLGINYPNTKDIQEAQQRGIKDPGKDIRIHGLPNSWIKRKVIRHPRDWTKGCMAVTNDEIEQIFVAIDLGTLIEICP